MIELDSGDSFAGYIIDRKLGSGGWGIVYLAQDPRLPRAVALKLLDPAKADPEARQRFEREADFTAALDHPNIVTIFDRGVTDDIHWIAMQFVHGTDAGKLADVEVERALRIGAQIADALDYAHRAGVLHRDVKPSNFLIAAPEPGRRERALLTDFGIARLREVTTGLTRTGSVTGTAAYVSPEQVSGDPVDHRSDQYSLACSLFVLLTGRPPFPVTNSIALMHAHVYTPPLLPGELMPELATLDPVFAKALAKDPADRFDTCGEFVAEVARVRAGISDTTALSKPVEKPKPQRDSRRDRKLPRWALPVAGAAVVMLAVLGYLILGTDVFGGARDSAASTVVPAGASSGWDTRHAPAAQAFPGLIGGMNANTGWRGALCRQNDPGSTEEPADHDYARISCVVQVDDGSPLVIDIMDRAGSAHARLGLNGLVAKLFNACDPRPQSLPHAEQARPPLVVTCTGSDYSHDTTHPPVWTFFPDSAYSRFVIVMSWQHHTIDQLIEQWQQLPLGR
ncbi:serine/threonine-protein kinase [Nocardia macrotermitis]|uniref:non-specific serine/threonine protein kinase n=1 Tax=Nocardia macrotermitis TaxID=2585198 RepID=A0A7K0DDR8_9NOCA|nr:serine/threonine-protein kinase [Nocardia macrotermitis]MQY23955.1 Serine/threonine-protein kinase PknD [Nocardia macrotermitis]